MTKTPFEVRLDVVKIAQEMLDRKLALEQDKFSMEVNSMMKVNVGGVANFISLSAPIMYTESEVVKTATTLYNFVNDRGILNKN